MEMMMTQTTTKPRRQPKKPQKDERRVNLSKDILAILAESPQPISAIVERTGGKRNSIKSVMWKLIQQGKVVCVGTAQAFCVTGPKVVNIYSTKEPE